jgi:hypothetical protein
MPAVRAPDVGARHAVPSVASHEGTACRAPTRTASPFCKPRLIATAALLTLVLAGCAFSPEAARVRGEPGADVGNHGNPVVLVAPPDRVDRVYAGVPYDGPAVAHPDTSES